MLEAEASKFSASGCEKDRESLVTPMSWFPINERCSVWRVAVGNQKMLLVTVGADGGVCDSVLFSFFWCFSPSSIFCTV